MYQQDIHELIKAFGSQKALADCLKVDAPRISEIAAGLPASAAIAMKIELLSEGRIPAERLVSTTGKYAMSVLIRQIKHLAREQVYSGQTGSILSIRLPLSAIETDRWSDFNTGYPISEATLPTRPLLIDEQQQLLFSLHRLKAQKKRHQNTIQAYVIDLKKLCEHPTSTPIDDTFTVMERVAIGFALEAMLGKHQGKRTDILKIDQKASDTRQLPQNFAEVNIKSNKETREFITITAGFRNRETYRQACLIFLHGTPALCQAVAQRQIAIYRAVQMARLSKDEQVSALTQFFNNKNRR